MDSNITNFDNVPIMWQPPTQDFMGTEKTFIQIVEEKYQTKIKNYWDFYKWSVENLSEFWGEIWNFSNIICSRTFDQVIDTNVPMSERPKWFEGAKLNFAENLLRHRDDHIALITAGEDKEANRITYSEMFKKVELYAAAFRKFGLKKGDVVAAYISNREEPVFAMLATASIGAIWAGALPLLGAQAVLNRLLQIKPKVLITIDRFRNNQEEHNMLQKVKQISEGLSTLEMTIIVPSNEESKLKDITSIRNSCFLEDFLKLGVDKDGSVSAIQFEQVSFSHPVFINYTSGTTGMPKPIVHGSGGLLPICRDFNLTAQSNRDNTILSFSPVGWVSWNMTATNLVAGTTIMLFEGVPYFLSPTYIWDMVDEFKIRTLFFQPSVLDELEKRGYVPTKKHNLESLMVFVSTGSVVKPHNYDFVYKRIKSRILFFSSYVSTELMAVCMTMHSTLPIRKGELTCPTLGISVECFDDSGNSVIGEPGELVISKPMPSLPLGLWGDTNGSLFKKSYFSKFTDIFSSGDVAIINPITKGIVIYCRSDETLKPGGVRFGSSEIYNIVNALPEIQDSLCVSQYSEKKNERAVLFVKMRKGHSFDSDLMENIRLAIEKELSLGHVPGLILETPEIPHNVSGKKMEVTVKKIINGMTYNAETVSNPESLVFFRNVPPYVD